MKNRKGFIQLLLKPMILIIIILLIAIFFLPNFPNLFSPLYTDYKEFEFQGYKGRGYTQRYGYVKKDVSGSSSIDYSGDRIKTDASVSGSVYGGGSINAYYDLEIGTLHDFCIDGSWSYAHQDSRASSIIQLCSGDCVTIYSFAGDINRWSGNVNFCSDLSYKEENNKLYLVISDKKYTPKEVELINWNKNNINLSVAASVIAGHHQSSSVTSILSNLQKIEEPECNSNKMCDDFNPCTSDVCINGKCSYENIVGCGRINMYYAIGGAVIGGIIGFPKGGYLGSAIGAGIGTVVGSIIGGIL